ncbi:MAG: hypothetical protein ACYCVU_10770, partial [Gammaproteobacteria bacterium]
SGDIEESSTVAMSDTTLDCKFQKAGVPGHIGTQGPAATQTIRRSLIFPILSSTLSSNDTNR